MITGTDPQVTWDTLNLFGTNTVGAETFRLYMEGDDLDFGNPQPVDVWIKSLLADGSLSRTESHDNREVGFRVTVVGDTYPALQAGEQALFAASHKATTFTWTAPRVDAITTVFAVVNSQVDRVTDDLDERRNEATYMVKLVCEPWTQSATPFSVDAIPVGGVTPVSDVIDECTSLTGFTGSHTRSVVSGGNAVRVTKDPGNNMADLTMWIQRTASVTITQPYIRIKADGSQSFDSVTLTVGSVVYTPINSSGGNYWFEVPAGTYSSIRATITYDAVTLGRPNLAPQYFTLYSIYQTNVSSFNTRKELQQTFTVPGQVRAPCDLSISHATNGLGDVIVYTYPPDLAVYSPGLGQFRSSGGTQTAASDCVAGTREPVQDNPTYTIPVNLLPMGSYHLVARMRNTAVGWATINYSAGIGAVGQVSGSVRYYFAVANTWYIVPLDWVTLPVSRQKGTSTANVLLELDTATTTVQLDMPWIFHTDGDISIVSAGAEKTVQILSPTPDEPGGMAWVGEQYPAGTALAALGRHLVTPPTTTIYTVATGTDDPAANVQGTARWYGRAGS